jgi:hypothetical protein
MSRVEYEGLIDRVLHKFKSVVISIVFIVLVFVVLPTYSASPLHASISSFFPGERGPEERGTRGEGGVCEARDECGTRMRKVSLRVAQRSPCDSSSNLAAGRLWKTPAEDGESPHPQSLGWSLAVSKLLEDVDCISQRVLLGPLGVALDRVLHQFERAPDFSNCLGALGFEEDVNDVDWTVSTADSAIGGFFGVVGREAELSAANHHDRSCVKGGASASLAISSASARITEKWRPL